MYKVAVYYYYHCHHYHIEVYKGTIPLLCIPICRIRKKLSKNIILQLQLDKTELKKIRYLYKNGEEFPCKFMKESIIKTYEVYS